MASANCNVPMMATVPLHNAMICCNALPLQYACTVTTHTLAHTRASPHRLHIHLACAYILAHKCTLYALSFHRNSYSIAPLYISLPPPQRYHTGPHHIICPPTPNVYLPISNITSIQIICMSDGRFTNYYQDCILCITLEVHLLFNFFSHFFMLHPHPCLVELIQNLVTIVTVLVVFISLCIHTTYFIIIHSIIICMSIVIFIIL